MLLALCEGDAGAIEALSRALIACLEKPVMPWKIRRVAGNAERLVEVLQEAALELTEQQLSLFLESLEKGPITP
jgi:hypothetical protein